MQILRPVVAQCYRGGRSIGCRQFSSSSTKKKPKRALQLLQAAASTVLFMFVTRKTVDVLEKQDSKAQNGKNVAVEDLKSNLIILNLIKLLNPDPKI